MNVLMIGGTGTISTPITDALTKNKDINLYVLNRGNKPLLDGAHQLIGDFNDEVMMKEISDKYNFDIVCNFIIFKPEQAYAQLNIFKGKIKQYIFISTVATYNHETAICINEDHEQNNQYSEYGRIKTKCEEIFLEAYKKDGFPITIVRPSQTYSNDRIPLSVKGSSCYSVINRMLSGKPVIVHGDGKSAWHSTHADDFALGFIPLIGNYDAIGEAYHVINDEITSWDMIYHHLYKLLNIEPNIVHIPSDILALSSTYDNTMAFLGDKQYSVMYDMSKIKKLAPQFICKIDIKTGLKMYLDYLENNPSKKIIDEEFDLWCDTVIESYNQFKTNIKGKI